MDQLKPSFTSQNVQVLAQDRCYQGFFAMDKLTVKHELFNGGQSDAIHRELFKRGEAVAVLMYDIDKDAVVLTEQFRIGALKEPSPWLFELVAGMIEEGEQPEQVAIREAQEESGAELNEVQYMGNYLVSPGGTDEKLHLYFAQVDSHQLGGIHGLEDEGEDIKVHVVDRETAFHAIGQGQINNAATIIAIQWLQLQILSGQIQPRPSLNEASKTPNPAASPD